MKPAILTVVLLTTASAGNAATSPTPDIVFILADDVGHDSVLASNEKMCPLRTSHLDRLREQGMDFTDAHSASAVCTPTRYGLLTGRYGRRTRLLGNTRQQSQDHEDEPNETVNCWLPCRSGGSWPLTCPVPASQRAFNLCRVLKLVSRRDNLNRPEKARWHERRDIGVNGPRLAKGNPPIGAVRCRIGLNPIKVTSRKAS
jgi:hypothetical protein